MKALAICLLWALANSIAALVLLPMFNDNPVGGALFFAWCVASSLVVGRIAGRWLE